MKHLTYDDEYESDSDDWNDVNVQKGKPSKQRFYHWTPKNGYSLFMALLL